MTCMKDGFLEGLVLNGRFESVAPLNHGSFGMVFLAKDLNNGDQVAIKCLGKSTTNNDCPTFTANDHGLELACHDRLGYHPNIVNLLHSFETDAHMYLVLEFCSMGDLYEAIRIGRGPLETEHVRGFMLQLVDAVEYMHSRGLYHRDIKPENIFLAQDGSMKLGDFGLSTTETWTFESSVGSDRYMAPEQYDPADYGYCPAQADIWAVGICLLNILFSRNPFVTPSESDVLFADFVRDKQSLFDIFPNMSQDTFEVLVHAVALEPNKRSLSAVREALVRAVSFTTDDEIFDEFCTEERDVVPASANRQPLRTPSIASPPVEQGGAFPWAKALHMSPPQTARQLSVIHDTELLHEDLFPAYQTAAETASLASVLDSALGASVKSMNLRHPEPRNAIHSKSTPISESLPITASKPVPAMSTIFGIKEATVSKSWSEMLEEDEEEEFEDPRRNFNGMNWSSESVNEDVTIRQSDFNQNNVVAGNTRIQSPSLTTAASSEGRSSVDATSLNSMPKTAYKLPSYSPPSKRPILDKWAALGNRRRAVKLSPQSEQKEEPARKLTKSGSGIWRRGFGGGFGSGFGNAFGMRSFTGYNGSRGRQGSGATTWERNGKDVPSTAVKIRDWRHGIMAHPYRHSKEFDTPTEEFDGSYQKEDGDVEWVGGWSDLHL